jgi:hypothetical protein
VLATSRLALEWLEDRLSPAVLTVNSTLDTANPSDLYLSLREAVAIVNSPSLPTDLSDQILGQIDGVLHGEGADRIVFDPTRVDAPIILSGSQLSLTLSSSVGRITIDGGQGVTVDGSNASRVFQVAAGTDVALAHLSITHGNPGPSAGGGGIWNSGMLSVNDSAFSSNSASRGGGIFNTGTLSVTSSTFRSNTSLPGGAGGGGIDNSDGTVAVNDCLFTSNSASGGGAINNSPGTLTMARSTLISNSGGGIANGGTLTVTDSTLAANSARTGAGLVNRLGTATVSNSTLISNSCSDVGGGIDDYEGTLTVSHSTLSANFADHGGGGIAGSDSLLTVTDSTLDSNSAGDGGALWYLHSIFRPATLTVSNSTLSGNSASGDSGGGLYIHPASVGGIRLRNSIIAGNQAVYGPDIWGRVETDASYNLVGVGDSWLSGIENGVHGNQVGTTSNPLDALLAPLGYYGGPTPTFALLPGSRALEAGDPAATDPTDQRGLLRVVGGNLDIGAFQSQTDPFLVTTLTDPGRLSGLLSLREAVALANVLPGDDTVSFADTLDGGLIRLTAGQLELSGTGGVEVIDGAGRLTLDGNASTRLVQVDPGTRTVVRGLALLNGNAGVGAGVYNRGTLTVADCVLYGNTGYNGGAILNQGWLTLSGSTLAFNVATLGAAIDNEGYLVAYNSTFAYNAALQAGGAVRNEATGTAVLTSLTISRNSADEGGGLDVLPGSVVLLRNCIVAGNYSAYATIASDIAGQVDPGSSYNLIGAGGSGGLVDGESHNLVGVADPGLTTPDFSSPQTPVFGFTADSPALGAGDPSLLDDPDLRLDQHGNVRTVVNIGAL